MRLSVRFQCGRWMGRRAATIAGSHGLPDGEALVIIRARADEMRGIVRDGFALGVCEMRPNWKGKLIDRD